MVKAIFLVDLGSQQELRIFLVQPIDGKRSAKQVTVPVPEAWFENMSVISPRRAPPVRLSWADLVKVEERQPAPEADIFFQSLDAVEHLRQIARGLEPRREILPLKPARRGERVARLSIREQRMRRLSSATLAQLVQIISESLDARRVSRRTASGMVLSSQSPRSVSSLAK